MAATYELLASESTVQVQSPTVVVPVVYCTIRTVPSGVVCARPVDEQEFFAETVATRLDLFAQAVEEIMALDYVIAGTGSQTLDPSGLLVDNVVFTVQYVPPGTTGTEITADATVPATMLNDPRATTSGGGITAAKAIVQDAYMALQSAAGG